MFPFIEPAFVCETFHAKSLRKIAFSIKKKSETQLVANYNFIFSKYSLVYGVEVGEGEH